MMNHAWSETGTATWIPSGDRWLYAWVHTPADGHSRGAVVAINSIGREQVIAFRSVRRLAIELARAGYTVIRPDLTGVGESSLLPDQGDLCEAWVADIDACARYARERLGQADVHGIGLRIGASLLGRATAVDGARVYWEPIAGKRWLRRQAVLRTMSVDIPTIDEPGTIEVPGAIFDERQVASLKGLTLPQPNRPDDLVHMEPDPDDAMRLHSTVSLFARVPVASIQRLVAAFPSGERAPLPAWTPQHEVVMTDPRDGSRCRERIVEVGPHGLPGVLSTPVDTDVMPQGARSVIFASGSAEPKDGPTALWVQIGRMAAARGHRSLRVDRRGSGDIADPQAVMDPSPFLPTAVEDFREAGQFMRERFALPVVGVGFCSGSWVLMRAASSGYYDEVIGIAQGAWRRGARYYERMEAEVLISLTDAPIPPIESEKVVSEPADTLTDPPQARLKRWLRAHLPYAVWRELGRIDRATCAEHLLAETAAQSTVTLLFGDTDRELFLQERGAESLDRLRRRGISIETEDLGPLDHALLAHSGRLAVIDRVLRRLGTPLSPTR